MGMMQHIFAHRLLLGHAPFLLPCPGASSACLGMGAPHFSTAVTVKGKFLVMGRQPPVLVLTAAPLQQLCQGWGEGSWHMQRMPAGLFLLFERLRVHSGSKGANL